jgi:hypothetical protein
MVLTSLPLQQVQSTAQGCPEACVVAFEHCAESVDDTCSPDDDECSGDWLSGCSLTHQACVNACEEVTAHLNSVALESAATPDPTLFTNAQYTGTAVSLPVGHYMAAELMNQGIADNTISSLRVAPGFKVEAFANGDFTGTSIIVSGDTPVLAVRQFDDQLSSVCISKLAVGATFYEFCNRGGYAVSLPVGQYTRQRLDRWGIGDNALSGVVPAPGKEVELFNGGVFTGSSRLVNSTALCLTSSGLDNATSSLRIRSSPIVFRDSFTRGLSNWLPETGTWQVQHSKMIGIGAGGGIDAWTYVSTGHSFDGPVVIDVDVGLVTGEAEIVFNSHGHWGNEYRVALWSRSSPAYPKMCLHRCQSPKRPM